MASWLKGWWKSTLQIDPELRLRLETASVDHQFNIAVMCRSEHVSDVEGLIGESGAVHRITLPSETPSISLTGTGPQILRLLACPFILTVIEFSGSSTEIP